MLRVACVLADFTCMAQGEKTPLERFHFRIMLPNVRRLVSTPQALGCTSLAALPLKQPSTALANPRVGVPSSADQINLLYLGCAVLILQDLSYLSRFW